MTTNHLDVLIIGAGAAGLMCAIEAGKRGRKTLVLDHANKAGKKILMSGGGRCNFTNTEVLPEHFISHNPHFCKSALSRYRPQDFIALVESHGIAYHEKTLGQLFCDQKSQDILNMLLNECDKAQATIQLNTQVQGITQRPSGYYVTTSQGRYHTTSLVIATGGLSIPTMGASPFGYEIAKQFGLNVFEQRAALVPLTLHPHDKEKFSELSGLSTPVSVRADSGVSFDEAMLFTHRGVSGPAVLQISSYWTPGESITVNLYPNDDPLEQIQAFSQQHPKAQLKTALQAQLPKRLVGMLLNQEQLETPLNAMSDDFLSGLNEQLTQWKIKPSGSEGYRTAEVTLSGVDCNELSSKTFEAKKAQGLYFIGEVLDVTGHLGGYNFQWAWASAWCAGQVV